MRRVDVELVAVHGADVDAHEGAEHLTLYDGYVHARPRMFRRHGGGARVADLDQAAAEADKLAERRAVIGRACQSSTHRRAGATHLGCERTVVTVGSSHEGHPRSLRPDRRSAWLEGEHAVALAPPLLSEADGPYRLAELRRAWALPAAEPLPLVDERDRASVT